jgi:hypothetical protein
MLLMLYDLGLHTKVLRACTEPIRALAKALRSASKAAKSGAVGVYSGIGWTTMRPAAVRREAIRLRSPVDSVQSFPGATRPKTHDVPANCTPQVFRTNVLGALGAIEGS